MEIREGKKVFHGIAIGKVRVFAKTENQVSRRKIEDTQVEVARFEDAKQKAIDQLHALYEKALKEVGEVNAQIFDVHAMMLDDGDYIDSIHNLIERVVKNAHAAGIWAGICGELGADTELTERFLQMGLDELSVSPGCILPVRKAIREAE